MALYYNKETKRFKATDYRTDVNDILIWQQKEPINNMFDDYRFKPDGSDITSIKLKTKRTRINNTADEFTYYMRINVTYKGYVLWPLSLYDHYLLDDSEIDNNVSYVNSTLSYNINMQEESLYSLFNRAYKDTCHVCNTNILWLYSDMISFLDRFTKYAQENSMSPHFPYVLAKVVKAISYYGNNLNPFFIESSKKHLVDYANNVQKHFTKILPYIRDNHRVQIQHCLDDVNEFLRLCAQAY